MKRKLLPRIAAFLLMICMLICSVSCKSGNGNEINTTDPDIPVDADPAGTTEPVGDTLFSLTTEYKIIRPDESETLEIEALKLLSRGISSACNMRIGVGTDFVKRGQPVEPNEFEIVIGATNRRESQEILSEITYKDWEYRVVSKNVIVICGGSPEMTLEATRHFLKDIFGYEENAETEEVLNKGSAAELQPGTENVYRHKYQISSLKIGNKDISEYTVVTKSADNAGALDVAKALESLSGKKIPIAEYKDFKGGPAIYVGICDKTGAHLDIQPFGSNRYYICESGEDIIIDYKTPQTGRFAAKVFTDAYLPDDDTTKGDVVIKLGRETLTGFGISKGTNGLVLDEIKTEKIREGMTFEERLYHDVSDKPVRAFIMTVEKGHGIFYAGTPGDSTEIYGHCATVPSEMKAAVKNEKNVVMGVNADFFRMGGDNMPRGLCVKNGEELHGAESRPWFGCTKDGKPVIGELNDYNLQYKGKLSMAVGGSHIIIRNDSMRNVVGTDFADTRHPRTAVGIKPNGDVVIMIVDGRQRSFSNGASLADLGQIFASMGCSDAINLDGGGSSTFVIRNKAGEYDIRNSPSEGSLRYIQNSLIVLAP